MPPMAADAARGLPRPPEVEAGDVGRAADSGDVVTYRLDWNAESEDWPPPKDFDVQWDNARVIVTHASRQQAVVVR